MIAWLLSNLLSPRGLIILVIVGLLGFGALEGKRLLDKYDTTLQQNIVLQNNITTLKASVDAQKKQVVTQQKVDAASLIAVQVHDTMATQQLTTLKDDYFALQSIKVPSNETHECLKSPYIPTILERLRANAFATTDNYSEPTGYAQSTGQPIDLRPQATNP